MAFDLTVFSQLYLEKQAVTNLMQLNDVTRKFGLQLTEQQAAQLMAVCSKSLKSNGRIALSSITNKLIESFCSSPYLLPQNYFQTICELTELFYTYKNETLDLLSDDALIAFMKERFDGVCQGSLELLRDRELYQMAKTIRFGYNPDENIQAEDCGEEEENE